MQRKEEFVISGMLGISVKNYNVSFFDSHDSSLSFIVISLLSPKQYKNKSVLTD